ncbi:hypothetical protein OHT59_19645 [Streptomyces sp. NBC_00243]|uniref:hypothetical protein n=1 Tax=Streptomyces sp. NBC_00243 TaxID=2975688 RepID=UPI002DDBF1E3|nr:hypothetical protein [Streptomyces sp. NBC_00243]WRZ20556.1 hypothetical protein OHT59_19645 [Streptomyces sp. NBC_00243]
MDGRGRSGAERGDAVQGLRRRGLAVVGVVTAVLLVPAQNAFAGGPTDKSSTETDTETGLKGDDLYAKATAISYDTSKNGSGSSVGSVAVSGSAWTPPACWYAPQWTAEQFAKETEAGYKEISGDANQPAHARSASYEFRQMYKDGEYKNYNLDKQDEGMWWGAVENPNAPILKRTACNSKLPFWVENGETPDIENAITPEILAGLAYEQIKVPGTEVTLSPEGTTKVNLSTWAWLEKGDFQPVSVTASLDTPGLNIQATTTATPVALKLEPGTDDATTFPASGECQINDDGSIGEPYAKGKADETPPCGITYLRSSGDGTYRLRATITWDITWTGTGGAGGDLPDGTFGNDQEVTVQEIQSVNR